MLHLSHPLPQKLYTENIGTKFEKNKTPIDPFDSLLFGIVGFVCGREKYYSTQNASHVRSWTITRFAVNLYNSLPPPPLQREFCQYNNAPMSHENVRIE